MTTTRAVTAKADQPLLLVRRLSTVYPTSKGVVLAARDVEFTLEKGRVLGLVGESGSGKTTTGLSIMRLIRPPGRVQTGQILFEGTDLLALDSAEMRRIRGDRISMVFQNPMSCLNPTLTVGSQIAEMILTHRRLPRRQLREQATHLLELVGIPAPAERLRSFPHELSGGMRQRVMIAMSIAMDPDILIADEPTTALDLTIQAQILWLLDSLRRQIGMAMIYVTHDLAVAANICDEIAVMYAGEIVEHAETRDLFSRPAHPYTVALLRSLPRQHWTVQRTSPIPGQPPTLFEGVRGCPFYLRCPEKTGRCQEEAPRLWQASSGHVVRCFHHER